MAKEKRIVILSVRVDDTLAKAIRELAEDDSRPVSNYIELLLRRHAIERGKMPTEKPAKGRKT
jgi:hypothetical protein